MQTRTLRFGHFEPRRSIQFAGQIILIAVSAGQRVCRQCSAELRPTHHFRIVRSSLRRQPQAQVASACIQKVFDTLQPADAKHRRHPPTAHVCVAHVNRAQQTLNGLCAALHVDAQQTPHAPEQRRQQQVLMLRVVLFGGALHRRSAGSAGPHIQQVHSLQQPSKTFDACTAHDRSAAHTSFVHRCRRPNDRCTQRH